MKIYLVRHGQTLFNLLGRTQEWSDSPLTELGMNQAHQVGKYLKDINLIMYFLVI
ncbi:histidine phosphatase family protein [Aerococcaceae bacterium DSM 111020]|nr:histidine phosphatase family protein [Aerococcaceae bacterium DSM 111020]